MEASAIHAPAVVGRLGLTGGLLRLRSDDQLVALFRAGSEDAFAIIHDRYRQRLFAYVRQMLSGASRADAEDVLQDVFVRAYGALRNDERDVNLRAWLYRVAHNRCIDNLRRPTPAASDVFEMSRTPLLDPIETAQRRDDLKRLVEDVGRLPEQQRSALLMREIDGMAYADIAEALDVTVPAVKSLLVRARVGLVEAIEARDTDCAVIRSDLAGAYDRGVKASGRARKHMRECAGCREYRSALRGMHKSFAALSPVAAAGPVALLAKALGISGAGGSAAAGGGAAVGGGATAAGTSVAAVTACKVAAVVCTAALATGGAVEVTRVVESHGAPAKAAAVASGAAQRSAAAAGAFSPIPVSPAMTRHRTGTLGAPGAGKAKDGHARKAPATGPTPASDPSSGPAVDPDQAITEATGGAVAPADPPTTPDDGAAGLPASGGSGGVPGAEAPGAESGAGSTPATSPTGSGSDGTGSSGSSSAPSDGSPPPQH